MIGGMYIKFAGLTLTGNLTLPNTGYVTCASSNQISFGTSTNRLFLNDDSNYLRFYANSSLMLQVNATSVGVGTGSPVTFFGTKSTTPYISMWNETQQDTEGGRECRLICQGEQSGGETSYLGYLEFSHSGTSDDQKGKFIGKLNDGNDGTTPSVTFITALETGAVTLHSALSCGADGATQGTLTLWDGSGGALPAYINLHSPNGSSWFIFVEDDGTVKVHNAAPTQNSNGSCVGDQTD